MKGISTVLLAAAVTAVASGGVVAKRQWVPSEPWATVEASSGSSGHEREDTPFATVTDATLQRGVNGASASLRFAPDRRQWVTAGIAGVSAAEASSSESFSFSPDVLYRINNGLANSVAIGDVNGDGLEDAVVATVKWFSEPDSCAVLIYLQQADGMLADPIKVHHPINDTRRIGLILADLNADNIQDIVIAYGDIAIALGNRGGGYAFNVMPMPSKTFNLGALDLDLDGKLDLVAHSVSYGMYLLYGDGNGGVRKTSFIDSWESAIGDLKVGDVTGDGLPDLVLTPGQLEADFYVYPHNGFDGFGPVQIHVPALGGMVYSGGHAVGDFNGDGLEDVALTVPSYDAAAVRVYLQEVDGSLSRAPVMLPSWDNPQAAIAVDLDNDGHTDLVTANGGSGGLGFYLNDGNTLSLQARVGLATPSVYASDGLAAGDLNGDGCPDVALADNNSGMVVLYGQACGVRVHRMSTPAPPRHLP